MCILAREALFWNSHSWNSRNSTFCSHRRPKLAAATATIEQKMQRRRQLDGRFAAINGVNDLSDSIIERRCGRDIEFGCATPAKEWCLTKTKGIKSFAQSRPQCRWTIQWDLSWYPIHHNFWYCFWVIPQKRLGHYFGGLGSNKWFISLAIVGSANICGALGLALQLHNAYWLFNLDTLVLNIVQFCRFICQIIKVWSLQTFLLSGTHCIWIDWKGGRGRRRPPNYHGNGDDCYAMNLNSSMCNLQKNDLFFICLVYTKSGEGSWSPNSLIFSSSLVDNIVLLRHGWPKQQ